MGDGPVHPGSASVPSSSSSSSSGIHPGPHGPSGLGAGPGPGPGPGNGHDGVTPGPSTPPTPPTPAHPPGFRHASIRIQEPLERRPLLPQRAAFAHNLEGDVFSCHSYGTCPQQDTAPHRALPVYTNIHRIRRDIISVVEDYLSLDQLRDVRLNVSVLRPLVDKLYAQDDISIVYCLLVNRAQFLAEQAHLSNRQNVNYTRAMLCELIATRILRRFNEDNEGPRNLLVLAHVLIAGFQPFQGAPDAIQREVGASTAHNRTLPALEVAILSESRVFLASTSCQKIVDAIYEGRVVYTPSSFMDIIPDRYKQRPISLYNPREAPLLNHYRLVVPRTRNYLEMMHFALLLGLYLAFMSERDWRHVTTLEVCFTVYALGWVLDQFATLLEHGWDVYAQNLWSFLDVTFAVIYGVYLAIRLYGWGTGSVEAGRQALDVLAMGAPVLVPRLAFNLLSDNLVFLSLRSMMSDFALLSALAAWCFLGFLLSLVWLGNGSFGAATISKWMIYIWFGLDGSGIQHSVDFHKILGPSLMVAFAFLGNTLFLTILVSMLSTTFSHIVNNAPAEIQFRRAVMTLEGVKGDAIFAYPPPFNILAILLLVPLKSLVSPRWFHKIHVLSVRLINLPILLAIAVAERHSFSPSPPHHSLPYSLSLSPAAAAAAASPGFAKAAAHRAALRIRRRFWDRWRITTHSDISTVFDVPLPDAVLDEIAADDDLTRHLIRRQFARPGLDGQQQQQPQPPQGPGQGATLPRRWSSGQHDHGHTHKHKQDHEHGQMQTRAGGPGRPGTAPGPVPIPGHGQRRDPRQGPAQRVAGRRDSIAPFPGLRPELQGVLGEGDDAVGDIAARLETLEGSVQRIEGLLERLLAAGLGAGGNGNGNGSGSGTGTDAGIESEDGQDAALSQSPEVMGRRKSLAELNREAEEE